MRVLLTGACGYVGSVLLPRLYRHETTTLDTGWFGGRADLVQDIREALPAGRYDAIIHLAGIANDPCGELDARLTWEVNVLGTMRLAQWAADTGVRRFIYASSGSVYGVSPHECCENDPLLPISDYNRTKMVAERVLLSYSDRMTVQIVRPATVCGWSPRMRLDVMVNSFCIQALEHGVIRFNGGEQWRPNIHIDDMADLYVWLLDHPEARGIYNAGFENMRIADIARVVADRIGGCDVLPRDSIDPRSYCIDSSKLLAAGFVPQRHVADAIDELIAKYRAGSLRDTDECYRLKTLRHLHIR